MAHAQMASKKLQAPRYPADVWALAQRWPRFAEFVTPIPESTEAYVDRQRTTVEREKNFLSSGPADTSLAAMAKNGVEEFVQAYCAFVSLHYD